MSSVTEIKAYISSLHLQDLALACACAEGHSDAWDIFVASYRTYLRSASAAILRCSAESAAACDLADSLFTDLYGVNEAARTRSLFHYFHGRSSLKTWLRAVLAQRHIDAIRASRRFTPLEAADDSGRGGPLKLADLAVAPSVTVDPHREQYLELFRACLEAALALLDSRDKERVRLYYAEDQTLAEIGRGLGEHESSVSRHLDRTRRELRQNVEEALRHGSVASNGVRQNGLSDAQIALCFEYASADAAIDFDKIFPATPAQQARKGKEP